MDRRERRKYCKIYGSFWDYHYGLVILLVLWLCILEFLDGLKIGEDSAGVGQMGEVDFPSIFGVEDLGVQEDICTGELVAHNEWPAVAILLHYLLYHLCPLQHPVQTPLEPIHPMIGLQVVQQFEVLVWMDARVYYFAEGADLCALDSCAGE